MKHKNRQRPVEEAATELDALLLRNFLGKERHVPARPHWSHTSTVIIRKQVLPFYYAIYDHDLHRFTELQYRGAMNEPMRRVPVPATEHPPLPEVA